MNQKIPVRLRIVSEQDGQTSTFSVAGTFYSKPGSHYIRYEEPASSDLGQTVTTIRITGGNIRVVRQGAFYSEQTYKPGIRVPGGYHIPQGIISTEAVTHEIAVDLLDGTGIVAWKYDLYVAGEHAGAFHIKLVVEEETSQ